MRRMREKKLVAYNFEVTWVRRRQKPQNCRHIKEISIQSSTPRRTENTQKKEPDTEEEEDTRQETLEIDQCCRQITSQQVQCTSLHNKDKQGITTIDTVLHVPTSYQGLQTEWIDAVGEKTTAATQLWAAKRNKTTSHNQRQQEQNLLGNVHLLERRGVFLQCTQSCGRLA